MIMLRRLCLVTFLFAAIATAVFAQAPVVNGVLNGVSSVAGAMAPGELMMLVGSNLGDAALVQCKTGNSLPTSCGGVAVLVNGKPVPLVFVLASQVTFQAPFDLSGTSATLQVTRQTGGQTLQSAIVNVPVASASPALATTAPSGGVTLGAFTNGASTFIGASNPAQAGDIVSAYGTGFGVTSPAVNAGAGPPASPVSTVVAPIKITVGGQDATLMAAVLAPAQFGLYQIVFRVPAGLAGGNMPVVVNVGGQNSPSVLLPVAPPKVSIGGVSNNASGAPTIASGAWVSIYGTGLSAKAGVWQASDFVGNKFPTVLDGVSVTINGKPAAVYSISPTQINVQAPTDGATGPVQVVVTNSSGSASATATLATYSPGFYTFAGKYVAAVHTDRAYVAPVGYFGDSVASRPAKPGETLLIFATGFGPTTPAVPAGEIVSGAASISDPAQLRLRIGGATATVPFAGIVAAGEFQFNVVVPTLPDGDQPIVADIAGVSSQAGVVIPVKN